MRNVTWPLTFQTSHVPLEKPDITWVCSTCPVSAFSTSTCCVRPLLSQSKLYNSTWCVLPSLSCRSIVNDEKLYHAAACRFGTVPRCSARWSKILLTHVHEPL